MVGLTIALACLCQKWPQLVRFQYCVIVTTNRHFHLHEVDEHGALVCLILDLRTI